MKPIKVSSYKGNTLYRIGKWSVKVTTKTVSERAGCGFRKTSTVSDWYAMDREDPINGQSFEGSGGMRNALKKLSSIAC